MSIITIKITFVAVILTIIAALFAIASDTQNAAASSRYLAPRFDTSIVKHADVAQNDRSDILFGSDDAAYRAKTEQTVPQALFHALTVVVNTIVPNMLPTTAAPHGQVTCTIGTGINQTTVTRDSCDDL